MSKNNENDKEPAGAECPAERTDSRGVNVVPFPVYPPESSVDGLFGSSGEQICAFARRDPEAFERWRTDLLNAFIADKPDELKRLLSAQQQWIEQTRAGAPSSFDTLVAVEMQMKTAIDNLRGLLSELTEAAKKR